MSKNNDPTSVTHLTIQSEYPYQKTLTNMDALQLLQPRQNNKSHQTSDLSKNNGPPSETHLTIQSDIQSEYPYQHLKNILEVSRSIFSKFEIRSHTRLMI